jgi:uncharacterized protein YjiS (DUF1127 family)
MKSLMAKTSAFIPPSQEGQSDTCRHSKITVSRWIKSARATLKIWQQRHRTRRQLATLDSHALKDIGVTRTDALNEAKKSFWRK